jgi:hypothetical protein
MAHTLSFQYQHAYDELRTGIEIPVSLKLGKEVALCQAKIDTGAQVCLFRRELGEELGLEIERGYRIELDSLGGMFTAFGHELTLHTLGMEFESLVFFPANFDLPRNLLGREGWLQKVRLAVVDYDSTLYLSPYRDADSSPFELS